MFILRCIFWLGLLFSAMPFSQGERQAQSSAPAQPAPSAPAREARPVLVNALHRTALEAARHAAPTGGQLARSAAARLEEICLSAPRDCIAAAQRLQVLFGDFSDTTYAADTLRDNDHGLQPARQ